MKQLIFVIIIIAICVFAVAFGIHICIEYGNKLITEVPEEIIHCHDCKWYGKIDNRFYRKNTCLNPNVQMKPSPMDYCSCGERRTDD